MISIAHMNSAQIRDIWLNARALHDELGRSPEATGELISYADQEAGKAYAARALDVWREKRPGFFAQHPYLWISDPTAFTLSSEAAFQVRTLELMIALWENADEYPVDADMFGEVLVRQTIVPRGYDQTPRAINLAGHGGVLVPMGWFDAVHYGLESATCLVNGDSAGARAYLLELFARTIADLGMSRLHDEYLDLAVDPVVFALARPGVSKVITMNIPGFATAAGDLDSRNTLRGMWNDLAYASTTIALGHEAAHILTREHLGGSATADEERADDLAFDMAARCVAWHARCPYLPADSPTGVASLGVAGFLFSCLLRLATDRTLAALPSTRESAFKARAEHIQAAAIVQPIPPAERENISVIAAALTELRNFAAQVLDGVMPEIEAAKEAAAEGYLQLLREQQPHGGVEGVP